MPDAISRRGLLGLAAAPLLAAAPIANQVEDLQEFGIRYAVLINPRYYGWDNSYISYSLHQYPGLFVAHGLLNPVSASESYEISLTKESPYRDTYPFFKAVYEEFGGKQLVWGAGYPQPRWDLPMDLELDFVDHALDFYTGEDRDLILGKNALRIWKFPEN
jgi:predicted TIM-barrel fold metal-dependent hydrolase